MNRRGHHTDDGKPFFVTGGTLHPDAPSYVYRPADRDLYEGLSAGEFCYILTARQMGKSSLMVRTAIRLREEGAQVVVLDLTSLGQNVTVEQWYDGLLGHLGRQLDLEDELEDFWLDHSRLAPLQRWMAAVREVALVKIAAEAAAAEAPGAGRLVVFIDEIDAVRSMPFSTDEFFAGIRECYNRRSRDPLFERLSFCLLGVATPSDLIKDTRTTPFNIGRRVEMTDFTLDEAFPLIAGIAPEGRNGVQIVRQVLYWTGGHPYLTQLLCEAASLEANTIKDVDQLCEKLFLSPAARERDHNLTFVRDRLIRSEVDRASVLDLYGRVLRRSKKVANSDANPVVSILKLSGIVRVEHGRLVVRNRIYRHVFDARWAQAHMPDAERQRQRRAFQAGVLGATTVSALLLAVMGSLALTAVTQNRRANGLVKVVTGKERETRQYLYVADMTLAAKSWRDGNPDRTVELLERERPRPGEADLRTFPWYYLWKQTHPLKITTFQGHRDPIGCVTYSPDGKLLATSSLDGTARLWDVGSGKELAALSGDGSMVCSVAFSPDGKLLASSSGLGEIRLWNVSTHQLTGALTPHAGIIESVDFSRDGHFLAAACRDGAVRLWDVPSQKLISTLHGHVGCLLCVKFAPGGKFLASSGADHVIRLWSVGSWRPAGVLQGHSNSVWALAFNPSGSLLASGGEDRDIRIWDVATQRCQRFLHPGGFMVRSLSWSGDGQTIAAVDLNSVTLWDSQTSIKHSVTRASRGQIESACFSPDGAYMATGGENHEAAIWKIASRSETVVPCKLGPLQQVSYSSGSHRLAVSTQAGAVMLWNGAKQMQLPSLPIPAAATAISSDGQSVFAVTRDGSVREWDSGSGQWSTIQGAGAASLAAAAFSVDGRNVVRGFKGGLVDVWNLAEHRRVASFKQGAEVSGIAYSPESHCVATGQSSGVLLFWDVTDPTRVLSADMQGACSSIEGSHTVYFGPDGSFFASDSDDGTVHLWSVSGLRLLGTSTPTYLTRRASSDIKSGYKGMAFIGHREPVSTIAFSPDGATLSVAYKDETVTLWNTATGQETMTFEAASVVHSLAFSHDGCQLAAACEDGNLILWDAASPEDAATPVNIPEALQGTSVLTSVNR